MKRKFMGLRCGLLIVTGLVASQLSYAQIKVGAGAVSSDANIQVIAGDANQFVVQKADGKMGVGTSSPTNRVEVNSGVSAKSGVRLQNLPSKLLLATNPAGDVVAADLTLQCVCGEVKHSLRATNHGNWYLLNGAGVPAGGASCASSLGFSGVLPNTASRTLMQSGSLASIGGVSQRTLVVANLPPLSYTATSASGGLHTHTTADAGGHTHAPASGTGFIADGFVGTGAGVGAANNAFVYTNNTGTGGAHNHGATSSSTAHTHGVTINGGSSAPINTVPLYYGVNQFICLAAS